MLWKIPKQVEKLFMLMALVASLYAHGVSILNSFVECQSFVLS